jgi:hypothetical protein
MGVATPVPIAGAPPDEGRRPDTPVTCVMDGDLPGQKAVLSILTTRPRSSPLDHHRSCVLPP